MLLALLTVTIVGLVMAALSVGVLLSNRPLRGSCGGPRVYGPDGEPLSCAACPRRLRQQCQRQAESEQATAH